MQFIISLSVFVFILNIMAFVDSFSETFPKENISISFRRDKNNYENTIFLINTPDTPLKRDQRII